MVRQALLVRSEEDSGSESLSDSFAYSETESLVESVGSVGVSGCSEPKPKLEVGFPRRHRKKRGAQFMHFSKKLNGVPVQKAWGLIREPKILAALAPGIVEGLDFLEGEGGTGSVYVVNFNPQVVRPGEDKFLMNKVEVNDDETKLYAVRCVGGKYTKLYSLYMTYINVLADIVDGDSSSVVVWQLEYEMISRNSRPPEDTKCSYLIIMDEIKARHLAMTRVERPLFSRAVVVNVTKRLRMRAGQQRLTGADEQQEPEDRFQQHGRRKGKGQVQQTRITDDEGSDRESKKKQRPRRKASNKFEAGGSGSGLVFRRRPPQLSQQLFIIDSTDAALSTSVNPELDI